MKWFGLQSIAVKDRKLTLDSQRVPGKFQFRTFRE